MLFVAQIDWTLLTEGQPWAIIHHMTRTRLLIRYMFWGLLVAAAVWTGVLAGHLVPIDLRREALLLCLVIVVGLLNMSNVINRVMTRIEDRLWFARHGDRLERLIEALAVVHDQATLQTLLAHRLPQIMGISSVGLYLRTTGSDLALVESVGLDSASPIPHSLPLDGQLAAYLTGRRDLLPHSALQCALADASLTAEERAWVAQENGYSWLPLNSRDALQGVLVMGRRPGRRPFTNEERHFMQVLAHQAGITAQTTQLTAEVRERHKELAAIKQKLLDAGEQERRRLARDLHDGAVQHLLGISYQLALLPQTSPQGIDPQTLKLIRQEILDVVSQLRAHIGELRPAGLEEVGLAATLTGYVARLQHNLEERGPEISLDIDPDLPTLSANVALCLFRVAQEGLRNALRHAEAAHIAARLWAEQDHVLLTVRDDGKGFQAPARLSELGAENHFGLIDMSERVAQVGGSFAIQSAPGQGTTLTIRVPIQREGKDSDPTDPHRNR